MELVQQAAETAEHFVAPLGRRWEHVQAVAARASELREAVAPDERDILIAAAWLHDIGYAPEIGHTRFHPLDGARYLRDQQWPEVVVNLVAHHSGARFEAGGQYLARGGGRSCRGGALGWSLRGCASRDLRRVPPRARRGRPPAR